VVLSVILLLLVLGGSAALVAVFLASDPDRGDRPTTSTSATATPISLSVEDQGSSVTVTWTDPSGGKAAFVVSYGRADGPANQTQQVGAGTTTVTVGQLDPAQVYCFTVAGEPGSGVRPSPVVCTKRPGPSGSSSPRPSGS
jgi:hypothetical protein